MVRVCKTFVFLALIAALCFALVGCSGSTTQSSESAKNFVGTWQMSEIESSASTFGGFNLDTVRALGSKVEAVVNDDKTFKLSVLGQTIQGTWEAIDDKTAKVSIAGQETEAKIRDDEQMSLSYDGSSIYFKKVS